MNVLKALASIVYMCNLYAIFLSKITPSILRYLQMEYPVHSTQEENQAV
jgi:hypothetical protein